MFVSQRKSIVRRQSLHGSLTMALLWTRVRVRSGRNELYVLMFTFERRSHVVVYVTVHARSATNPDAALQTRRGEGETAYIVDELKGRRNGGERNVLAQKQKLHF